MEAPATLQEAIIHFQEFENCKAFMMELRWPDGVVRCPHCGSEKVTWLEKARIWKCYSKHDRPRFSLKTGTIFEDSPLGLDKWLTAVWLIVNCKNGVSSYEVSRDIGITQKSAWFMDHRIRFALHQGSFEKMLSGEVEADESFIGGKARNMHANVKARKITGTGGKDKTAVMGTLERGGKVRTTVIANRKKRRFRRRSASMSKRGPRSTPIFCSHTKDSRASSRIRSWITPSSMLTARSTPTGWKTFGR